MGKILRHTRESNRALGFSILIYYEAIKDVLCRNYFQCYFKMLHMLREVRVL